MKRAGRIRTVALAGALLVLLTSCAGPASFPPGVIDLLRPQPVVNVQQARGIFDLLMSRRALALHSGDAKALPHVETGPLLESDRGVIAAEQHLYNTDAFGSTFDSVIPFVPRLTSYPAWFMVEMRTRQARGLAIVTRAGQKQPWKLESATVLHKRFRVSPAPAGQGFVQPGHFQRNLSADLSRYSNAAENHENTRNVLPGPLTSEIVKNDLKYLSQEQSNGWSVSTGGYTTGPFSFRQAVRLRNGAVLGFATIGWHMTVAVAQGARCFAQDPTRGQGWGDVGGSGSVSSLNLNGIDLYAVIESRAGDTVIGLVNEHTTTDLTAC